MIAVFDSGIGGLTVLRELRKRHPDSYVYFGDTEHLPYGTKSADAVRRYTLNAATTLQRHFDLKAFVIACHTASAVAADIVRQELSIPVFDMMTGLPQYIQSLNVKRVAILGTPGTIAGGRHEQMLRPYCQVITKACPLFVPLAEEGWQDHIATQSIANEYLQDLRGTVDAIVLACTHYPLLLNNIRRAVGTSVAIIDPATFVAEELHKHIPSDDGNQLRLFASDEPYRVQALTKEILGEDIPVEHLST